MGGTTHSSLSQVFRLGGALLLTAMAVWALVVLENRRAGLTVSSTTVGETPVTLYQPARPGPLVVVAHGFGGSRQMMESLSLTLAKSGMTVASFDFLGHGRHPGRLSGDVTVVTGTTARLVDQTLEVSQALRAQAAPGPVSFLGHSMATDVVIRAAKTLPDPGAVIAISMYSEAVTPTFPARLLVVSGAGEPHLRQVALRALTQVGDGTEGETLTQGPITRRVAVAPGAEHVGVLYSPTTQRETAAWVQAALGLDAPPIAPDRGGLWTLGLLAALLALIWPLAGFVPVRPQPALPIKAALWPMTLPIPLAAGAGFLAPSGLMGAAGFGTMLAVLATWGWAQLALLWLLDRRPLGPWRPNLAGGAVVLAWSAFFALALDRYGGAFLPTGGDWGLMIALLLGTLPLMLGDARLSQGAGLMRRIALRAPLVGVLFALMAYSPTGFGLLFTTVPVYLLFLGVFATVARVIARRSGFIGPGLALGGVLAWSIAATTPVFSL